MFKVIVIKIMDVLSVTALVAVIVLQYMAIDVNPEASREVYDEKMREYVLEHNIHHVREEAIEVRREFRNSEREHSRRSALTFGLLTMVFCYGVWRIWLGKEKWVKKQAVVNAF